MRQSLLLSLEINAPRGQDRGLDLEDPGREAVLGREVNKII